MIQGGHCQPCPSGKRPHESRTHCVWIDEQIIDYRNPWAVGAMVFALLGEPSTFNYITREQTSTPARDDATVERTCPKRCSLGKLFMRVVFTLHRFTLHSAVSVSSA